MNLQSYFTKQTDHLQELSQTWMQEIAASFPNDLEDKIKQSGVLKRKRGIKSGIDVIKIFLLYAVSMEQNADVILRITPSHFPIYNQEGQKIDLLPLLSQAKKSGCKTIEIKGYVLYKKKRYFTRLIIGQIPEEKAAQARKRKQRKAKKNQYQIKEKTLLYAGYVFLATSLGVEYDKEEVLSLYRSRWQVELLFKRFKQNLKIRTIRVASEQYASAMIYLWLIVWVLVERQVIQAERLLLEQQISRERISQWDLCRFYFIRTAALLCMSWSLFVDPSDIVLLAAYLQTHKCRRINQNFEFLSCILPGLIA